jgi:hypothetical protein
MITRNRPKDRQILYLIAQYRQLFEVDVVDTQAVAQWAISSGLWKRPPVDPEILLRRELARALRTEYYRDPQGRDVRKNHPVVVTEGLQRKWYWAAITEASPKHMRLSLQQRRQGILADCRQHRIDFDSYNDNNKFKAELSLFDYDFNKDLEELSLPTHYPNEKPEDKG